MAYWTVAGDPRNDASKGREWKNHCEKELAGFPKMKADFQAEWRILHASHVADLGNRSIRRRVKAKMQEWLSICRTEASLKAFLKDFPY